MSISSKQTEALLFHLKHIAGLEAITKAEIYEQVDIETSEMMLQQAARFADEKLTDLAATGDLEGCRLNAGLVKLPNGTMAAWKQWCELGFPSLGLPADHDGLGFPRIVQSAIQEICDGANLAFGMLAINLRCAALALIKNNNSAQIQQYIPGLVNGDVASTISISEPQAGSDVGRILTSAQEQPDGSWLLNGSKIWISYADHDATAEIIHLVLAKVANGETGTRALGLFLVPGSKNEQGMQTNGISILRLEHKMGLHASPTCVVELIEAKGYLIGTPGRGLQALFVMMNAMRLAVAVQGAAAANAATLHAIAYATERPQGGSPLHAPMMISQHADVRRMLLEMTAQSELARALALRTASMLDLAETQSASTAITTQAFGELMLPVAKTINAEIAFQVASQGIQVLGGYGYTSDYPLERIARDIRVAAIYEGTSGIQALDFLKRRVMADKGAILRQLMQVIKDETSIGISPFSTLRAPVQEYLDATVKYFLDTQAPGSEAGAYALLNLTSLMFNIWNGHSLYCAASGGSDYENRLKAALEYYAPTLPELAALWAGRALQEMPGFQFS